MARNISWYIEPLNEKTTLMVRDAISTEHEHQFLKTSVGERPLLFSTDARRIYQISERLRKDSETEYILYRQLDGREIVWQSERSHRLTA